LAFQGKKGELKGKDYRGEKVLAAYAPLGLPTLKKAVTDFENVIISQIDESEASEHTVALAYRIALIAVVIAALVALFTFFFSRAISRPVVALAGHAAEIAKGNLSVEISVQDRNDELGALAKVFHGMVEGLRGQTRRIMEGVNVLSAAASEISATVSQLAANTAKTSSAVSETTTTAEEVKQAAQVASEKARKVAESSHKAVQISEDGRSATEETMGKMQLIKEQMESIGETVVRLSEHSKAIEDIIGAVQDLADQSNLLAVNASIEAARAGDQGKGFAVVAHEIKSLADQSREATDQVRSILEETRKWVAAVVMATEQGGKAVQAGVEQSVRAGQSIQSLAASVCESSQAASVIETSAGQQFLGVDQVSGAMVNIQQAMHQNLTGTNQLKAAAQKLSELGEELKTLVEQYRV
ncbi:MAG: methyl-accepting chemotaxis protein, partial [Deltaproteobacteria bacterium]|nr:methyl-accepting chemotaxis protein [Deltaproteobacteria bacterium]